MNGLEHAKRCRETRTRCMEMELNGVKHLAVDRDEVVALGLPVHLEVVNTELEFGRNVSQTEFDSVRSLDQRHGSGRTNVDRRLLEPFGDRLSRGDLDGSRDTLCQIVHNVLAGAAVGGGGGLSGRGAHGE